MDLKNPVDVLARTIFGEARGEGARGMQAVANVVCNRAAQPAWWGHDIISVCLKPEQFSCWNRDDPNLPQLQDVDETDPVFQTALEIATDAVVGSLPDITGGADHYERLGGGAPWAKNKEFNVIIGHQAFYKLGPDG